MKRFGWDCSITYSCPRCGRPFLTEFQLSIHMMSCGAVRMHQSRHKRIEIA